MKDLNLTIKPLFVIILMFVFGACGGDSPIDELPDKPQQEETKPTPTPEPEPEPTPDPSPQPPSNDMAACDANAPVGFGEGITGGEGGESIVVTTATELQNALKQEDALIIYIKGEITVNNVISVLSTDKTILGLKGSALVNPNRTQSQSGILYFKKGSSNLILRNLTFKSAGAYDVDGRDNLCIDGTTNVWVDHCDFQDGVDGNFDCKNASDNVAVTWCRFRYLIEPQSGGSGGSDDHRFSNLWGSSDSQTGDRGHLNTTFQYCWWDEGCRERMPRVRFGKVHIANCLYSTQTPSACIGVGKEADIYVDRTVFSGPKKAYKTHNDDGNLRFEDCLFTNGTPSTNGTGSSFTPTYSLPTSLNADEVEAVVSAYAGTTLSISEP